MKFPVDAQLPRRMCAWLGPHDAVHTTSLPYGNRTPDAELIERADLEDRILVTKDDDFVQARLLHGRPQRLWLITTGNIGNDALEALVRAALAQVEPALAEAAFIELGRHHLTIRD